MNPLSEREADLAGEPLKPLDHYIREGLEQLHQEELLCDTTIVAKGERFPCHRILLAAINPYFRAMFSNSFRESQDGEVLLQDMDPSIIQMVVQYYYTEEIELTPEVAEDLYEAASRLQIIPLLESCSSYLLEHLCPENCLSIYQLGYSHNDPALFQEAKSLVHAHFKRLSQEAPAFLDLNPSTLESILASDNLLVSSELLVYRAVWRWVQAQSALRLPFLARLLAQVRFPLLTPEELHQVQTELLQRPKELRPRWRRLNRQERLAQCGGLRRGMFNTCIVCVDLFNLEGPELRTKDFQVGCYDPQAGLWEKLPLLERLYCARCVALRDRLFVTGGVHTDDTYSDTLHEYSPLRGRWSQLAPMSVARASHGFLTWGGRLFALGGWRNFEDYLDSAESYDLTERRWARIARLPLPLSHFASAALRGRLYLVGGATEAVGAWYASRKVLIYQVGANQWTQAFLSSGGYWAGAVAMNEGIYVVGGYFRGRARPQQPTRDRRPESDGLRCTRRCFFLGADGRVDRRVVVPPLPVELAGAGVVRWKQRIYVLGGENVALGRRAAGENEEEYYNTVYYWEQGAPRWIRCQERLPFANWGVSGFGCAAVKLPKKPILELFRKTAVALTGLEGPAC
ncbi:kelch-like protein 2 [Ahaetulla prasina]|uniref:kelch-like protein 2 n=1 Tax=Ahaetulla prasina TaxID=499056 RepID=UPI0026497D81|nr:kelch-like protein 2 [Ahaetulla prasina]